MAKKINTVVADQGEDKWRAESDARTLIEAAEIRADKPRLKAAIAFSKVKMQQHKGIVQDAATESFEDDDDGDE